MKILINAVSFFSKRFADPWFKNRPHGWGRVAIKYAPIAGIALIGLLLRFWIISEVGFNPKFFDLDGYHGMAVAGLSGPVPTDHHPPGYSWFLSAIYSCIGIHVRVVYVLQAFLGIASVLLVGCAAQRRYGMAGGCLAAALLSLSGYLSVFPSALASENLCVPGVAVLTALLLPKAFFCGRPRLFVAAVILGCLGLVRTAILGLTPGLALLAAMDRKRDLSHFGRTVSVVVVLVAALLPAAVFGLVRYEREGFFRLGSPWDVYNLWGGQ